MAASGGCKGKSISSKHVTMLTVVIMSFGVISCCLGHGGGDHDGHIGAKRGSCIESERRALLDIRSDMYDSGEIFSTWIGEDCCRWRGVACDNTTSHVIKLDLHYPYTRHSYTDDWDADDNIRFMLKEMGASKVNPALRDLKHLKYLDLSMNNFFGSHIPHMIASLVHLEYLNLSNAMFDGLIPPQLGNLSNLHYLDLGGCGVNDLRADDLDWLSRISSLKYVDMSSVNLSKATNWLHQVNSIPSLEVLDLSCWSLQVTLGALSNLKELYLLDNRLEGEIFGMKMNVSSGLKHLDLKNKISGQIPEIIGNLTNLKYLDLSSNNITRGIPIAFGDLIKLENLNLFGNKISGQIPETIRNLTNLKYLDISFNNIIGGMPMAFGNLINLESLLLRKNNISRQIPKIIGNLTNLEYLDLSYNNIVGGIPMNFGNLINLNSLDLSQNKISGQIPETIGNLNIRWLDLSDNFFSGQMPETFNRLYNLQILDVSYNHLTKLVFGTLNELCNLSFIDLSLNYIGGELTDLINALPDCNQGARLGIFIRANNLSGIVPSSIGQLSALFELDISSNLLKGNITEAHFSKLINLAHLDISYNSLNVILPNYWLPPFNAYRIIMNSCHMGTKFPAWIQTQTNLKDLSLSGVGLLGHLPTWFSDFSKGLWNLNLSSNNLNGPLSSVANDIIDLSNNSFVGPIPLSFANASHLRILSLSHNNINGSFPSFFCNHSFLEVLDISNNNLSGKIPTCHKSFPASLQSLHLNHNNLSGKFPSFLKHCAKLVTLDLSENNLYDEIPTWVGENLLSLGVLSLKSNLFYGTIPVHIANLTSLQVLDLSSNNLSGSIPSSLANCSAMVEIQNDTTSLLHLDGPVDYYGESIVITAKGYDIQYTTILSLVTSIDLSNNNLSGEIPNELTKLHGLHFLNLSNNHLTGAIPENIGSMEQLESLDLSMNNLTGDIPSSFSSLNFLSHLNLSHNNLSGRIPTAGGQMSTFN
ncbi:unnamed protein product, partial [Musa acuminata var. zebrina]